MPGKELYPSIRDERQTFKHGTNRMVEIALRHELDDVAKKSLDEIVAKKEMQSQQPLDNEEYISRRLRPSFAHRRLIKKMKSKPVYHDDLLALKPKAPQFMMIPNIPPYNPLDKFGYPKDSLADKVNTYPYARENTVTTQELRKPRVTSVGIVPVRTSNEVEGLKVIMEGKPVAQSRDVAFDEMEEANLVRPETPGTPDEMDTAVDAEEDLTEEEPKKKPAILGSEGTSMRVKLASRPTRAPHPSTIKRKMRGVVKSTVSTRSSMKSEEIVLPDEKVYEQYDAVIADMDSDLENVTTAMGVQSRKEQAADEDGRRSGAPSSAARSVKDMLDEAKRIVTPGAEPVYKMRKKITPRKKETKKEGKKSKDKGKGRKEEEVREGPRSERTVDEIIASLRSQSTTGLVSDADRKIQEIMDRVISRSSKQGATGEGAEEGEESRPATTKSVSDTTKSLSSYTTFITEETGTSSPYLSSSSPWGLEPLTDQSSPSGQGGLEPLTDQSSLSDVVTSNDNEENKKDVDQPEPIEEVEEEPAPPTDEQDRVEAAKYLEERQGGTDTTLPPAPPSTTQKAVAGGADTTLPPAPPSTAQKAIEVLEPLIGLEDILSEDEEEPVDIQKAWEDVNLPDATQEDIVGVVGQQATLEGRHPPLPGFKAPPEATVQSGSVSFLSAWKPVKEPREREVVPDAGPSRNVHHFCTVTTEYQLPEQFWHTGRKYLTPSRYEFAMPDQRYRFGSGGPTPLDDSTIQDSSHSARSDTRDNDKRRISAAARRVLQEVKEEEEVDDSLEAWQHRAQEVFEQSEVVGTAMPLKDDESRLYWTPAPPKLDVAPAKVKEILFPDYQRATVGAQTQEMHEMLEESSSSEEEEEEEVITEEDKEQLAHIERVLLRKHNSTEDLTDLMKATREREQDIRDGKIWPYEPRLLLDDEQEPEPPKGPELEKEPSFVQSKSNMSCSEIFPVFVPFKRSTSMPDMVEEDDDTLLVAQDYNTAMEEIRRQKDNVRQMKIQAKLQSQQGGDMAGGADDQEEEVVGDETIEALQRVDPMEYQVDSLKLSAQQKKDEPTPAELALAAGRAYVILPKKKKKKRRASVTMARLDEIETFLRKPCRKLPRSESMIRIAKPLERELRVPQRIRDKRRRSCPDVLNFKDYGNKRGLKQDDDTREWVRDIWNIWFDEVFPPTPPESDYEEEEELTEEQIQEKEEEEKKRKRKESLSSSVPEEMEYIEPITENEESLEIHQIIGEEIEKLTEEMNQAKKPKAFDYSRRGALYRKIGYLKAAEDDLSRAIQLEPLLLDAYWHRHLLYVLQDKKREALEDLQFILKHTKSHAGAYRSMAEIYMRQDDITMAIVNYTQAIKLNPRDHAAYFARAECYEKRGDMLLALEDYSACTKICPTRVDAILKHGMYYFENKSWNNAINDFTDLLKVDPLNASARVLRGRAHAAMGQWSPAVEDLSAAIHLDPNHWVAFYHRACILRKAHPKRALQDYSVSLLINDTEENISSYLHRGILYNAMKKPEDSIPDFESVLKLNKDNACAHVNLGLIMMNHYHNYHRAIKRFTSAIKVDPTYVRAYVCRGEAYHKIHELKLALRDFTRAIHLRPDIHHYYMYRGQLLLELGQLDLAAFCVRQASELGSGQSMGMGQRPTQQAVVHSFLKNYNKAIEALQTAARAKPVAGMFMLLGKTQIKAKKFSDAINSFEMALQLYKPWKARDPWPMEAADSHYLIGQCNMELRNYLEALEAFTNAIKLNGNMAEALYHRGMARMKLKLSKGIQDFNRALAINPRIFQAYLSRACFYGMKGLYTKAILNCNEAIKLQPHSVRAYLYRGSLKFHIKAFDLAIRDLSKAASIDSTCALAYFNRAVCYQENKEYQKALTDYGIVLLLGDQLSLKVLINRGLLYFERKDYTNALYDFKLAAKMNPDDHQILHTLGLCYHKLDRLHEAVKTFTACVQRQPYFLDGTIARGNVYMDYGHEEGLKYAMRDYERVLRLDPMCLPARVNLAYTLQVSGRFMQAWRQFSIAIEIKPTYKPALEGRSVINLQMSDTFAAYQDISAAIYHNATAELLTNRGVIHQFMNDRVNAMRDYQEALALDPTYSLAYFNAANVYFHTRHFTQALDYYNKTIEHGPKDESAFLNRAITKVMLKDAKGAHEDFKIAIKLSPHSAHMYLNRGNLYASTQQYEQAEKDYTKALELQPDDALVLKRRADVRGKLGKKHEAVTDYKQAIELQGRMKYLNELK